MVGAGVEDELLSGSTLIVGMPGPSSETLIVGTPGPDTTKFGTGRLDCEDNSVSGRWMVGTVGADTVTSGIAGRGRGRGLSPGVATEGDSVNLMTGRSRS